MSNERRLHPVDVAVLRHLRSGVDYPTVIAFRADVDRTDVERRCERLTERDLVEPISHEVVYRITHAGLRALEARERGEIEPSRPVRSERAQIEDDPRSPVEEGERSGLRQRGGE